MALNHFSVSVEFHTNNTYATILKISWGHIKVLCVCVCVYQVFSPSVPPSDTLSSRGAHPNPRLFKSFSFLPGEPHGAWQATVHGVAKSGTRLSDYHSLHSLIQYSNVRFRRACTSVHRAHDCYNSPYH